MPTPQATALTERGPMRTDPPSEVNNPVSRALGDGDWNALCGPSADGNHLPTAAPSSALAPRRTPTRPTAKHSGSRPDDRYSPAKYSAAHAQPRPSSCAPPPTPRPAFPATSHTSCAVAPSADRRGFWDHVARPDARQSGLTRPRSMSDNKSVS